MAPLTPAQQAALDAANRFMEQRPSPATAPTPLPPPPTPQPQPAPLPSQTPVSPIDFFTAQSPMLGGKLGASPQPVPSPSTEILKGGMQIGTDAGIYLPTSKEQLASQSRYQDYVTHWKAMNPATRGNLATESEYNKMMNEPGAVDVFPTLGYAALAVGTAPLGGGVIGLSGLAGLGTGEAVSKATSGKWLETGDILPNIILGEAAGAAIAAGPALGITAKGLFTGAATSVGLGEAVKKLSTGEWLTPAEIMQNAELGAIFTVGGEGIMKGTSALSDAIYGRLPESTAQALSHAGYVLHGARESLTESFMETVGSPADYIMEQTGRAGGLFRENILEPIQGRLPSFRGSTLDRFLFENVSGYEKLVAGPEINLGSEMFVPTSENITLAPLEEQPAGAMGVKDFIQNLKTEGLYKEVPVSEGELYDYVTSKVSPLEKIKLAEQPAGQLSMEELLTSMKVPRVEIEEIMKSSGPTLEDLIKSEEGSGALWQSQVEGPGAGMVGITKGGISPEISSERAIWAQQAQLGRGTQFTPMETTLQKAIMGGEEKGGILQPELELIPKETETIETKMPYIPSPWLFGVSKESSVASALLGGAAAGLIGKPSLLPELSAIPGVVSRTIPSVADALTQREEQGQGAASIQESLLKQEQAPIAIQTQVQQQTPITMSATTTVSEALGLPASVFYTAQQRRKPIQRIPKHELWFKQHPVATGMEVASHILGNARASKTAGMPSASSHIFGNTQRRNISKAKQKRLPEFKELRPLVDSLINDRKMLKTARAASKRSAPKRNMSDASLLILGRKRK